MTNFDGLLPPGVIIADRLDAHYDHRRASQSGELHAAPLYENPNRGSII